MRRTLWFGLGVGTTVWVQRTARRRMRQYAPPEVVERARQRTVRLGSELKAAVGEGRQAMRDYQEQAQAELEDRPAAPRRLRAVGDP